MASPTTRTLALLRKRGYTCGIVEKWIPQTKRRLDLFGGIDIVAIQPGETIGVQCTSQSNSAARATKLRAIPQLRTWIEAGNRLCVIGWTKKGPAGKRKLWQHTLTELYLADMYTKGTE